MEKNRLCADRQNEWAAGVYQVFSPTVTGPEQPFPGIVVPVLAQISPVEALYAQPPRVPTITPLVTPVTMESGAFAVAWNGFGGIA